MQINLNRGVSRVKLTQSERRTLANALDVLESLRLFDSFVGSSAEDLRSVIGRIDSDGVFLPFGEQGDATGTIREPDCDQSEAIQSGVTGNKASRVSGG